MLIEDNPDHALLIRTGLENSPDVRQVTVIGDGEQALNCVRAESVYPSAGGLPDLVLLDLKLSKVDGLDVLRAMRASPVWQSVPVVVLTTSTRQTDIEACYASGANDYVAKSGPADLAAKARELASRWLRNDDRHSRSAH